MHSPNASAAGGNAEGLTTDDHDAQAGLLEEQGFLADQRRVLPLQKQQPTGDATRRDECKGSIYANASKCSDDTRADANGHFSGRWQERTGSGYARPDPARRTKIEGAVGERIVPLGFTFRRE